jgi:hypothetical protein
MTLTTVEAPEAPPLSPDPAPVLSADSADLARIRYGVWLIGAAFLLLGVVFGIGVSKITVGADMVAALGSVTTVVGTIIGTFFGVQIGSHGKEAAEAGRTQAEKAARTALSKLDPSAADDVIRAL